MLAQQACSLLSLLLNPGICESQKPLQPKLQKLSSMSQKCVWWIWERGNHAIRLTVNLNYTHLYQSNIEISWTALKRKEEPSKVLVCCNNQNQYSVQDIPISTQHKQKTKCTSTFQRRLMRLTFNFLPSYLFFYCGCSLWFNLLLK